MVWPWKKRNEVVDLTKMKNLLPANTEEVEIVDLSAKKTPEIEKENSGVSALGSLGSLANAGKPDTLTPAPGPITAGLRDARDAKKEKLKAVFNEMRLKIDDTDYKTRNLLGKVDELEKRIKELERRKY